MIDWNRLRELREEVGADDFDEVIELFLDEVDTVINTLRAFPDPVGLENDLHFLKGSALSLGFRRFSDVCQTFEHAAAQGNTDQVDLKELLTCYDSSRDMFLTNLQGQIAL